MISLLISNYNNSRYLLDCLQSALAQNGCEIEILLCDDASTDNSMLIINEFKTKIQILQNEKNRGVGFTKKRLIEASKGDYFIFLDSDDVLIKDCLSTLYLEITKAVNISMVYGQSVLIKSNKNKQVHWKRSKRIKKDLLDDKFNFPIFHPIMYSKKHYLLTEGMNANIKSGDDFDLWYKMEEVGEIRFLDIELYKYRENFEGVSQVGADLLKWTKVMVELSHITALATQRRNLELRNELDQFAEIIYQRIEKQSRKKSRISIFIKKFNKYFRSILK